jgi:hypothetical protein
LAIGTNTTTHDLASECDLPATIEHLASIRVRASVADQVTFVVVDSSGRIQNSRRNVGGIEARSPLGSTRTLFLIIIQVDIEEISDSDLTCTKHEVGLPNSREIMNLGTRRRNASSLESD